MRNSHIHPVREARARLETLSGSTFSQRAERSIIRFLLADDGGQVLPWVAVATVVLICTSALVLDVGNALVAQRKLQASTDAAALAAAQSISGTTTTYQTVAGNYGADTGGKNTYSGLNVGTPSVTGLCLSTVQSWGIACTTSGGKVTIPNAVRVTQSATINTFFAGIFGKPTLALSATATAANARPLPYNIALIVDSTLSMNAVDSNCNNLTQEQCALQGVRQLLTGLSTSYDHVALFTFPNVVIAPGSPAGVAIGSNGAAATYKCTTTTPSKSGTIAYYNGTSAGYGYTPLLYNTDNNGSDSSGGSSQSNSLPDQVHYQPPWTGIAWAMPYTFPPKPTDTTGYTIPTGTDAATYQVTPFLEDYNTTSGDTNTLVGSSALVQAVGGVSGCGGIVPSSYDGDFGTYYAGAIYAAQAALLKEQTTHPNSANAIIILGDGDSNSPQTWGPMYSMPDTATHAETTYGTNSALTTNGYTYPASWPTAGSGGSYPSWKGQCGQAIDAGQYAATYKVGSTTNGTAVYTIAYDANTSGCTTDKNAGTHANTTPCKALQLMATQDGSSPTGYFYSDVNSSGSGCTANTTNSGLTAISDIYLNIQKKLSGARLIPDSTT